MSKEKNRVAAADVPIQFRPGAVLSNLIQRWAKVWKLSRNEAARRLVALAAAGLDHRDHDTVKELVDCPHGPGDFVDGCERIRVELEAVERTRTSLGQGPLDEPQRHQEIRLVITRCVNWLAAYEVDTEKQIEERLTVRR